MIHRGILMVREELFQDLVRQIIELDRNADAMLTDLNTQVLFRRFTPIITQPIITHSVMVGG